MLIIYPNNNWNSFLPLSDLVAGMEYQFPTRATEFLKLPIEQQNASAMNAGTWIRTCNGLKIPSPVVQDIIIAQIAIMATTMGQDPLAYDPNEKAITKEKVGDLEVNYDPAYKGDTLDINPLIYRLLSPYGCSGGTSNGFSQSATVKA